ncbi:D-glycero-beta-D-manno-heptose 1-phosphate adenylyltransferase [Niabella sp.]|uniref:D-glycero-beta-D-manno-heptose 1-phosphate adenylyltransferase n=1 Tax=Niabella sp. TaxID=1962976 RepID=UPI0026268932|nr:D-glycero-beta-D-manno-heptose 1-phosphate adenylyltransferase [Niabella sp.]
MNCFPNETVKQFNKWKILVIGDLILDHYVQGETQRLCPEGPVPVVEVMLRQYALGGSANAALNFSSLSAQVTYCSVAGGDPEAAIAIQMLRDQQIEVNVLKDPGRSTLLKTRVMAGRQLLARFDSGTTDPISPEATEWLKTTLMREIPKHDAIVISDYDKGILTADIIDVIQQATAMHHRYIAIDSKRLDRFRELQPEFAKPNYGEALQLLKEPSRNDGRMEQVRGFGDRLYACANARILALTADKDGAVVFNEGKLAGHCPPYQREQVNVVGAGDVFFSAFTLAHLSGAPEPQSLDIASAAAAVGMMQTDRTCCCTAAELAAFFSRGTKELSTKEQVCSLVAVYRSMGKRIVFTNGCFDILHRGHISYLSQARALGDVLIVGINFDESVRRLKGAQRPVNPLADRKAVLAALACVTHLIPFGSAGDDTAMELIDWIQPDIYVKGGDYSLEKLPEASLVEARGGRVEILPLMPGRSTTGMIHKINPAIALKTGS